MNHHIAITKSKNEINIYLYEKDNIIKKNNFRFDAIMDEILKDYNINIGEYDFIKYEHLKNIHLYKLIGEFLN